jgi:hypothetical protein
MAHRHKVHAKAKGGALHEGKREVYAGAASNVAKEAEHNLHKHGGKVVGKVHGHKGKHRIAKKRGGGVGSDTSPFTSAEHHMDSHPAGQHRVKIGGFQAAHGKG